MHGALIRRVDPWQAGARGDCLEGEIGGARLPRLGAIMAVAEPLRARLAFQLLGDPRAAPTAATGVQVQVQVRGRLEGTCQRCLGSMDLEVAVDTRVLLAASQEDALALEGEADAVVVTPGESMDPAALVEDEVMLALPFAPAHPAGSCAPARTEAGQDGTGAQAPEVAGTRNDNPFAVLRTLGQDERGDS